MQHRAYSATMLIRRLYSSAYNAAATPATAHATAHATTANATMLIMRDLEMLLVKCYYCYYYHLCEDAYDAATATAA